MATDTVSGSFRDPSGFVYFHQDQLYRQVNECYRENYDLLMSSGLYDDLVSRGWLIAHEEVDDIPSPDPERRYKTLKPEFISFISYPYEWCFGELKDAALLTLGIQRIALEHGMTLKDCSAYNVQFRRGKPVFIDTLSFEKYVEGTPWTPYQQFCRHFLGVLALMSYTDVRLRRLFRVFVEGLPLDLVATLLPWRTRFKPALFLHIHLHARSQRRYSDRPLKQTTFTHKVSKLALLGLLDSLEGCVRKLRYVPAGTEWADYYTDDSYTSAGLQHKKRIVADFLRRIEPKVVWDLGANTGVHSRLASALGAQVIAFDVDPACVEKNYLEVVRSGEQNLLPLVLDLNNPSPAIGWETDERLSIFDRANADTVMVLALIHHLAISNNIPLGRIADFCARICRRLIIEFVPKSDHKAQRLLATRKDVFPDYTQEAFEAQFASRFDILKSERITESERVIYLMERNG